MRGHALEQVFAFIAQRFFGKLIYSAFQVGAAIMKRTIMFERGRRL